MRRQAVCGVSVLLPILFLAGCGFSAGEMREAADSAHKAGVELGRSEAQASANELRDAVESAHKTGMEIGRLYAQADYILWMAILTGVLCAAGVLLYSAHRRAREEEKRRKRAEEALDRYKEFKDGPKCEIYEFLIGWERLALELGIKSTHLHNLEVDFSALVLEPDQKEEIQGLWNLKFEAVRAALDPASVPASLRKKLCHGAEACERLLSSLPAGGRPPAGSSRQEAAGRKQESLPSRIS